MQHIPLDSSSNGVQGPERTRALAELSERRHVRAHMQRAKEHARQRRFGKPLFLRKESHNHKDETTTSTLPGKKPKTAPAMPSSHPSPIILKAFASRLPINANQRP